MLGICVDETGATAGGAGPADGRTNERTDVDGYLHRRRSEIPARMQQLHERLRELADRGHGSTPGEAERARSHADEAHEHARAAHEHAAECHEEAAAVHLRVADALERHGRIDRAEEHRSAADADRARAAGDRTAAQQEVARRDAAPHEASSDA